ncbi:NACHT, LRR and PYD domains-containing protein 12-like [Bufo gargarizans]|uniref:NACHT, LRR and PYD domains-containing protein 12-like n=1 Tax=Bufo gargarizans TaxID=30331 RepID=UPI001CF59E06|nr:NACHT, LRR and PYD domains-containing protein 12-like [Bufo gargarizans]XP_044153440.1 NACHT, LRR and PYD domains-containing protein 12-like [Bufo gargarizans]
MEKKCSRVITDDDVQKFRKQLSQYKESSLRILYSYFWNDLKHIMEILDTHDLLRELTSRNVRIERDYLLMKKDLGAPTFSECLIQDIKDLRRKAILALWESLFVLQNKYQHPNLIGLLAEFSQAGSEDTLVSLINLDEEGHDLHELKETHECHKKHLLEMTKELEEHNAPGVEQPRQSNNIYSCYLDLIVVSSQQFRKRSQQEITETGGRLEHYLVETHTNLERISPNRLFRWCHHSDCIPHAVMVSGVPGVGKTTLMQKFVYDWVTKKHYQRFSFVFFFKFRELNRYGEDKVSLDKLISEHYPYLWTQLDIILQDPKKLLFIFDGLDESIHNIDFGLPNLCCNPREQVNLGVIVVSLVRQGLLKGSSILLTGRPTQLASIDTCVFQRVSEIMGFLPKEREMYFECFFKNDKLSTRAFQYVRENDALYTFCYIPSYCWIICKVLSMCFEAPPQNNQISFLPKTATQLFLSYVANTLINHCTGNECPVELIKSIGKMAQYGIKNHILTFDLKDLESFEVDIKSKSLSSFVIENNSHSTTYSFLHLTIQEFFSALIHYLDSEIDMKSTLDRDRSFKDGPSEMFIRFLCGLSDKTNSSPLSSLSLSIKTSTSKQVTSWLSQEIASKWTEADPREKMNMLTCLFESRHTSLVQDTIGPHSHGLDFSDFHLTPMDCTVLAFILESCGEIEYLNLDRCFIQSEGLERLAAILHTVRELRLSNNDLKDSDMPFISRVLTHEACRVQILSFKDNSLNSCSELACVLNMNQSLVELDLSRNNLACPDFSHLMAALSSKTCTISRLLLQQIKLTDEYSPFLISLSQNPNLNHLDLSYNFLTDASAEDIQRLILCSQNLTKISIQLNDFTEKRERNLKELESVKPGLSIAVTNKEASDNVNGATKRHS